MRWSPRRERAPEAWKSGGLEAWPRPCGAPGRPLPNRRGAWGKAPPSTAALRSVPVVPGVPVVPARNPQPIRPAASPPSPRPCRPTAPPLSTPCKPSSTKPNNPKGRGVGRSPTPRRPTIRDSRFTIYGAKPPPSPRASQSCCRRIPSSPPKSAPSSTTPSPKKAKGPRGKAPPITIYHLRQEATPASNRDYKRDGNGKFSKTNHPGTHQREGETPSKRDAHGTFDEAKLAVDTKANAARARSVVTHLMAKRGGSEPKALYRQDTGWVGIDYGEPGNKDNAFAGGHGLAHILAKHPKAKDILVDTLQKGEAYKHPQSASKLMLIHGNTVAVLTKRRDDRLLITDYVDVPRPANRQLQEGRPLPCQRRELKKRGRHPHGYRPIKGKGPGLTILRGFPLSSFPTSRFRDTY